MGTSDHISASRWVQNLAYSDRKTQFVWKCNSAITKIHNDKSKYCPATYCSKVDTYPGKQTCKKL